MDSQAGNSLVERTLREARQASYSTGVLKTSQKNEALARFGDLILEHRRDLLEANERDRREQEGKIPDSLFQRLVLDENKLGQLVQGIRDVVELEDPVGRVLATTRLDEGLILEKVSVPLGVIGIIFESRPDVIPQILSLILKSGNVVVLKGGSEALHSNRAFMKLVDLLNRDCNWLPDAWARLLDTRDAVQEMLRFPEYVDLVIPRGSSRLVKAIMESTQIPVLGHTEGVCHIYIHAGADLDRATILTIDSKVQYPAACNAVETLLVDRAIAGGFLGMLWEASKKQGVKFRGCPESRKLLPGIQEATEADWTAEYGNRTLAVRVVGGPDEAICHVNTFGSHHTDAIVTEDREVAELFLNAVDSASVFVNASTRFADGFRYGLGAEIGISTNRTHARGPVGLEGLVSYKYKLRGTGQVVSDYVGANARKFLHQRMD